jgi:hypothetical protein
VSEEYLAALCLDHGLVVETVFVVHELIAAAHARSAHE